jgi:hypothetical protein
MEGKEQSLISIIVVAVFLLAPMILKLLGKKFGVKQINTANEKPDDELQPFPLEIPRQPELTPEQDNEMQSGRRVFSDKPIKPKWF